MMVFEVSLYDKEGEHKVKYVASDDRKLFERTMDIFIEGDKSLSSYKAVQVLMSENDKRVSLTVKNEFYK